MADSRIAVDPERELAELRAYMGDAFDHTRLQRHSLEVEEELARTGDEATLYRTSQAYLYDLTAFAMSRTKEPYLRLLARRLPPRARVLDMGCGIGSDGLVLLEAGHRVEFADFDNPSTRYLRWRLEYRGLQAPIHDLDAGPPPGGFDAAYSFDVIEHVADPVAFLQALEERADLVCVNLLEPAAGETELHRPLPIDDLVARAARRRLRDHRIMHGRSHLLVYDPRPARGPARLLSALRVARGGRRGERRTRGVSAW